MSNIYHFGGKLEVAGTLKDSFEKQFHQAEREAANHEGGCRWLRRGVAVTIASIHGHIDKDLAEGKLDPKSFEADVQLASLIKRYVTRVGEGLENLALMAENEMLVANGKAVALKGVVEVTERHRTTAQSRVNQLATALQEQSQEQPKEDEPDFENMTEEEAQEYRKNRKPGEPVGPSPMSIRKAEEEKKEKPAKKVARKPTRKKASKKK